MSLCQTCAMKHSSMEHFKEHKLKRCCPVHSDGLATHICKDCYQPVCTKCILVQHSDHQNKIVKHEEGVTEFDAECKNLIAEVNKVGAIIRENRTLDIAEMEKSDLIEKEISDKRAFHLKKAKEAEDILKELQQINGNDRYKILESYSKAVDEYEGVRKSLSTEVDKMKEGEISSFKMSKQEGEHFIKNTKALMRPRFRVIPFVLSKPGSDHMVTRIEVPIPMELDMPCSKVITKWLNEPQLVKNFDIYKSVGSKFPEQVQCVGESATVIADRKLENLPLIDQDGALKGQVPTVPESGKVTGLSVFEDTLFVAQQRCVNEYQLSNITHIVKSYFPNIKSIYGVLAVTKKLLAISDYYSGAVYEYRTESNITKEVLSGLKKPSYISKDEEDSLYIVTIEGDDKINIYNKDWKIMKTVGILHPKATVVIMKSLLVADRDSNRISQYSLDGKFQLHRLHEKHGILHPVGLAYNMQHLLVLERNNPSHYHLKYFKVFEST